MISQTFKMNYNPLNSGWTLVLGFFSGLSTYFLNIRLFGNILNVHPFFDFMGQGLKAIILGGLGSFGAWAMKAIITSQINKYGNFYAWCRAFFIWKKRK